MNENTVAEFINVTDCDRRTACYLLNKFGGNLEMAISFFYDNGIQVPANFSLAEIEKRYGLTRTDFPGRPNSTNAIPAANPQNKILKSNQSESVIQNATQPLINDKFERKYEVEDEIKIPEFLHRKKPLNPDVFFPNPQTPHTLNDSIPVMKKEDVCIVPHAPTKLKITEVSDVPHHIVTLYQNGLLCDDKFIDISNSEYNEIYKSLEVGEIPKIFDENSDVEVINKSKEDYKVDNEAGKKNNE